MKNIKKYRIVLLAILILFSVFLQFNQLYGWIEISEGHYLIIGAINGVLKIALAVWILISPTKPRK